MDSGNTVILKIDERKAVLIAGGIVQLLIEKNRKATRVDRYTELLALSLLNQLSDLSQNFQDVEIKEMVDTAVNTALSLSGEVLSDEVMDGIQASTQTYSM